MKGYHGYCHGKYCSCHRYSGFGTAQIVLPGCQQLVGSQMVKIDGIIRNSKFKSNMLSEFSDLIYYSVRIIWSAYRRKLANRLKNI